MQAAKRLAQLAVDTDRDVLRLSYTLDAFERLSEAREAHEVEDTLAACLEDALGLASVRLFLIDRRRKRAASCSGPPVTTSWRAAAMETQGSLVAWCGSASVLLARASPAVVATVDSMRPTREALYWAPSIHAG